MTYSVKIPEKIFLHIKNTITFYSSFINKTFIENFTELVFSKINSLNFLPERYPVFKNDIRIMNFNKKYKIFYRINHVKKEVLILRFSLSSQDDDQFF